MKKGVCGISLIMEHRVSPCAEEAQAHQCNSRLLDIPERLAAWKSLTEDVLEFEVEVPLDVWAQQAELGGR
jgi:hypothetical protein